MTMTTELQAAIDRSISHTERVHLTVEATDIGDVIAELGSLYDGEIDWTRENDGAYDVWGCAEGSDDMDWRLCVTLA